MRQTEKEVGKERWLWLSGTGIKRETESLIMAAQEQAIRTIVIDARIDRTQEESKCRMCGRADETINHLLSECSKMAQKEYKRRHDWMWKRIHWNVCKKNKIQVKEKWYEHKPAPVSENEKCSVRYCGTLMLKKLNRKTLFQEGKTRDSIEILITLWPSYYN